MNKTILSEDQGRCILGKIYGVYLKFWYSHSLELPRDVEGPEKMFVISEPTMLSITAYKRMKWNLDHKSNRRSKQRGKHRERTEITSNHSNNFYSRNIYRIKLYPNTYITFCSTAPSVNLRLFGSSSLCFILPPKHCIFIRINFIHTLPRHLLFLIIFRAYSLAVDLQRERFFFKKKTNKNNLISDLLHQPVKDSFLTALILHCGVTIL